MGETNHYRVKWRAAAAIAGEIVDIAGFKIDYTLDEIPHAEIYPTLGRNPENNTRARSVRVFLNAQPFTPLQIYLTGETRQDNPEARAPGFPPNQSLLVFDGYYEGAGYSTMISPAGGRITLVGHAAGWLGALEGGSSRISGNTVKGPGGFAEFCNMRGLRLFDLQSAIVAAPESMLVNLWLDFIEPIFRDIINEPSIWGTGSSEEARDALNRMNRLVIESPSSERLPLQLGALPPEVVRMVAQGIAELLFQSWRQGTLWSTLKLAVENFHFHIVPTIKSAAPVAVYPALNGDVYAVFTTNDYYDIRLTAMSPIPVTKFVVFGDISTLTSAYSAIPRSSAVFGTYPPEGENLLSVEGLTIVRQVPHWLSGEVALGIYGNLTVGASRAGIPDAVNPSAFVVEPAADYQEIFNNYLLSEIGNYFAQYSLHELFFRPRTGSVSGRFRLDVAPGSTVAIEVIDDQFRPPEPSRLYGLVDRVTLSMSAGDAGSTGDAHTEFGLSYLRSQREHEHPNLTAQDHPMYATRFEGTPLWTPDQ